MFERGSVPYEPASFPPGPLSLDCCRAILNGRVTDGRESTHVGWRRPGARVADGDVGVRARPVAGADVQMGERLAAQLGERVDARSGEPVDVEWTPG
jgi:hypothetical protein